MTGTELKSLEINPYMYDQFIFDKSAKVIHWGKNKFSTNGAETTGQPNTKR